MQIAEVYDRVAAAAARDDRSVPVFLRRFILANIDVIDPPTSGEE